MYLVEVIMVINSIWVNRNNNVFDNLDYKPQNEIKNLKDLLNII